MFKRLIQWNQNRIQRNYDKIILIQYSPDDQEKIIRGKNVLLTTLPKERFENMTNLKTRDVSSALMPYDKRSLRCRMYEENIEYWYNLGNLETDIMFSMPIIRIGPDAFQVSVGRSARILGGKTNRERLGEVPYLKIEGDITKWVEKIEERGLVDLATMGEKYRAESKNNPMGG